MGYPKYSHRPLFMSRLPNNPETQALMFFTTHQSPLGSQLCSDFRCGIDNDLFWAWRSLSATTYELNVYTWVSPLTRDGGSLLTQ